MSDLRSTSSTDRGQLREALKPCPFCGGEAEVTRYGDRSRSTICNCTECGCRLETGEERDHGEQWNTRAVLSAEPQPEAVEAVLPAFKPCFSVNEPMNLIEVAFEDASYTAKPLIDGVYHWIDQHIAHDDGRVVGLTFWMYKPPLAPDARMRRVLERIRDDGPDHGVRWCRNIASEALRAVDASNASAEAIHLFCQKDFFGAGGLPMTWKIECDALSDSDLKTIAAVCAPSLPKFCEAVGVPRGGLRLAVAMNAYADPTSKRVLIVDDVWTTGKSMTAVGTSYADWIGFVAFARGPLPSHVSSFMALSPAGADEGKESGGIMAAARKAQQRVETWSDAKKDYAERTVGSPSDPTPADIATAFNTIPPEQYMRPAPAEQWEAIARIKNRIDLRLNDYLCEMKPGYDDSITGFNEAWDIVRKAFDEALSTRAGG